MSFRGNSIDIGFPELSWKLIETLIPWIQWVKNQVIEKYETNGDFLVFRSIGSLVSLIQVTKKIEP